MRLSVIALMGSAAILAGPALAADAPAATATPAASNALACTGPFAKDSDEAALKAAFGADNVVYKSVPGAEGTETNATVIFPNDPTKTITVFWWDEEKHAKPAGVQVQFAPDPNAETTAEYWKTEIVWTSPQGVKVGSTIEEVQAINGKPFVISGFGWDYGGFAVNWSGGTLDFAENAECSLSVRFSPSVDNAPEGSMGDTELASDNKDVLAAKPRVSEFTLGYPAPDAPQ